MAPVRTRALMVCVARSMATSSSLSCMVEYTVVLRASIHRWLGVLAVATRLTSTGC
ncbi:hypothetical protein D3C78_1814920 [compost metagenome]